MIATDYDGLLREYREYARLVDKVLKAQKAYFKSRDFDEKGKLLSECRDLESSLRKLTEEALREQGSLFR